jgi:hypothetical protein
MQSYTASSYSRAILVDPAVSAAQHLYPAPAFRGRNACTNTILHGLTKRRRGIGESCLKNGTEESNLKYFQSHERDGA